jgi:uncharacterized protein (DUF302 family)
MMGSFGIHARFSGPFDEALTQIDLQGTLKKKLGVDFRRYEIVGACSPSFAYRALQQSLDVGLLLPCNVILYEEDGGATHVAAIDPLETLAAGGAPALKEIAQEVHAKLERVIARVGERVETETS